MSITSGFFNSVNNDRVYNAEQFSYLFESIIEDGIFSNIGDAFNVTVDTTNNTVKVGSGRGFFRGIWINSDSDEYFLVDDTSGLYRLDYLTIRVDKNSREATIKYLKGEPGATAEDISPPVILDTDFEKDYPFFSINSIPTGISTYESLIGTNFCPIAYLNTSLGKDKVLRGNFSANIIGSTIDIDKLIYFKENGINVFKYRPTFVYSIGIDGSFTANPFINGTNIRHCFYLLQSSSVRLKIKGNLEATSGDSTTLFVNWMAIGTQYD